MLTLRQIIKRVYDTLLARIRAVESALTANILTVASHGTSDTGTSQSAYEITPNKLHTWGSVTALYLSFGSGESGKVNEYMFRFTAGSNFELSLPASVRWSVEPSFVDGNTYEISIIDNLAICAEFEPAQQA